MPAYDFLCTSCGQPFEVFLSYSEYDSARVKCVHCGSLDVRRRMTRVRIARSEESRIEGMADESALQGLEENPQAMGRMMRKMGKDMGEDLPPEFDDMVDRLEAGQSPEEIESAMPEMGGEEPSGMDEDL